MFIKKQLRSEVKYQFISISFVVLIITSIFAGALWINTTATQATSANLGYKPYYYYIGDMVNSANGNLYLSEKDISVKARGFNLEIIRSYNSHDSGHYGSYGFGWTFNYNIYLVENSNGSVTLFEGDGSLHTFKSAGGVDYTEPRGLHAKLKKNGDGSFVLRYKDGSKYSFDSNGKLINITDKNNNHLTFSYTNGLLISVSDESGLSITFNYDSYERISSITDPLGRLIRYEYSVGDLVKVTDAMGNSSLYAYYDNHKLKIKVDRVDSMLLFSYYNETSVDRIKDIKKSYYSRATNSYLNPFRLYSFEYDDQNKTVYATDAMGYKTSVQVNSDGNPIKVTDPLEGVTRMDWDSDMNLVSFRDANGHTTTYEYDSYGNLVKETDPTGNSTLYGWNNIDTDTNYISLLTSTMNARGFTTSFEYDVKGNLNKIINPDGNSSNFGYDAFGNIISARDFRGYSTLFSYDKHGNLLNSTDATGNITKYSYDTAGRLLKVTDANGYTTSYEYDANDRLVKVIDATGNETIYNYNAVGSLISTIDANGHETGISNNIIGRVDGITDASGNKTSFRYDKNGNLIKITDAKGNITTTVYDALGRVISVTDALGNTETYNYDTVGNLISFKDKNGNTTYYTYDALDRVIKVTDSIGVKATYSYDAVGNLLKSSDNYGAFTTHYSYDALDRLISKTVDYGSFSKTIKYTYDQNSNRKTMIDPNGNITTYTYDAVNRLVSLTDPFNHITKYQYDNAGRRIALIYPNGVYTTYIYDGANRLLNLTNWKSNGDIISSYAYAYDNANNRLRVTDENGNTSHYEYDALDRLTKVTYPYGTVQYSYDAVGNRLTQKNATSTLFYTYDADNRLLSAGSTTYSYDNNGNLISKTEGTNFTYYEYDSENQLTKVILPDASVVSYQYSANGNRLSKTTNTGTTYYFYDSEDVIVEFDENGVQKARYTHRLGIDEPISMNRDGVKSYYLFDGLGSVTSLTDINENVVASYKYDVFGNILEETGNIDNPYAFTSREYDKETELYYYRARYYDADVGRFLSKDPIGIVGVYTYVSNNPVNYIDPFGLKEKIIGGPGYTAYEIEYEKEHGTIDTRLLFNIRTQREYKIREINREIKKAKKLERQSDIMLSIIITLIPLPGKITIPINVIISLLVFPDWIGIYPSSKDLEAYKKWAMDIYEETGIFPTWEQFEYSRGGSSTKTIKDGPTETTEKKSDIPRGPGGDTPDDNYDVSTLNYTQNLNPYNYKSDSKIAILSSGFYTGFSSILDNFNETNTLIDIDLSSEELNSYPVLVIPSGSLYGLSSLQSLKYKLEQYVSNGGTLVVYAQQHGYDYDIVPGTLGGFGWLEDQSCQYRSVSITNYHPILSGQDSVTSDVNIDGYFTTYPENATILLSRTKNSMPALLMYKYGNGTVIATTAYTDWAYSNHAATIDGKNLIRDMIYYAKNPKELQGYGSGDSINLPINISSYIGLFADKVSFKVIDPDKNTVGTMEVTTSISPYAIKTVNFTYTAPSKLGIWHLDYSLVNDSYGEVQYVHNAERFAVSKYAENPSGFVYQGSEISFAITTPEEYYAYGSDVSFTIHIWNNEDSDKNISVRGSGVDKTVLVTAHSASSFVHTMQNVKRSFIRFWVSFYDENNKYLGSTMKGMWGFNPSVDLNIKTDKEYYYRGSSVHATLTIQNKQPATYNTTASVKILDSKNNMVYSEEFNTTLNAKESKNIDFTYSLWNITNPGNYLITADANSGGSKVGTGSTYFEVMDTGIVVTEVVIPKVVIPNTYDKVALKVKNYELLNSTNNTLTVSFKDPDGMVISNGTKIFNMEIGETKVINFTLFFGNISYGNYKVEYVLNNKVTGYIDMPYSIASSLKFDKSEYAIRDNMKLELNITNDGNFLENATISVQITALSFNDTFNLTLYPDETNTTNYILPIPVSLDAGKYDAIITIKLDNTTIIKKYSFFIPASDLVISLDKTDYSANEVLNIKLKNVGGVDTNYNFIATLYDPYNAIFGNASKSGYIEAGEIVQIDMDAIRGAMMGKYSLVVEFKDHKTKLAKTEKIVLNINGLEAEVSTTTDKKYYVTGENITADTHIINNDGEINNATINLNIVSATKGYRIPVTLQFSDSVKNLPVVQQVNFSRALQILEISGTLNESSIKVFQGDGYGNILNEIQCDFIKGDNYSSSNSYGLVVWSIKENIPANSYRYYYIYFDINRGE